MLKTRVITAVTLLVILLSILAFDSFPVFAIAVSIFFALAAWESLRLFGSKRPLPGAVVWSIAFGFLAFKGIFSQSALLFGLCTLIWAVRLAPSLAIGLPPLGGTGNRLLNGIYGIAIFGCFAAMLVLFKHSALYLFSVMAVVWIADIGAYFTGKAFGKHKLAPAISPGKSWEGAIGGWISVLAFSTATILFPLSNDLFPVRLQTKFGWPGFLIVMSLLVGASIIGDLFESQLKRRANMKDSSKLLPGHGGILDRIDALIPTLPIAVLFNSWL